MGKLADVVRETQERSHEVNPHVLAEQVLARLPKSALAEALAECLPDYCRKLLHVERYSVNPRDVATPKTVGRSRLQIAGEAWQRLLAESHAVPTEGGVIYKAFAECSLADCLAMAQDRRERAAQNAARAEWFEGWASVLREHQVERIAQLPQAVLMEKTAA